MKGEGGGSSSPLKKELLLEYPLDLALETEPLSAPGPGKFGGIPLPKSLSLPPAPEKNPELILLKSDCDLGRVSGGESKEPLLPLLLALGLCVFAPSKEPPAKGLPGAAPGGLGGEGGGFNGGGGGDSLITCVRYGEIKSNGGG